VADAGDYGGAIDGFFASSATSSALSLLGEMVEMWRELPSAAEVFSRLSDSLLPALLKTEMHTKVRGEAKTLEAKLARLPKAKRAAKVQREKVKMLRLLEPQFDDK